MNVEDACDAAFNNRDALFKAGEVSCYSCLRTYPVALINKWTDRRNTAWCPYCNIDAVIPGAHPTDLLQRMYDRWFTREQKVKHEHH